jgi:GT2 family glycosyltransferase
MKSRNNITIAQGVNLQSDGKRIESVGKIISVTMQTLARCEGLEPSECPEKPSYATYAMGNLMVIKLKPVIETRGYLFKEELFLLWEETELALDMWNHGFKTIAIPEIVRIHMGSVIVKKTMPLAFYAAKRNKYLIYRRTLSPYLRSKYLYMPLISEVAGLYLRIFQGSRVRMISRGFIDGIFKRELIKTCRDPYEPLLLAPRIRLSLQSLILTLSESENLLEEHGYLARLKTLVVDYERLKSSSRPYIIRI